MQQSPKKIAIIGTGISGLVAAYLLNRNHNLSIFEAAGDIGGHTATKTLRQGDRELAVDTGFIVFNDRTYPNFIKLLSHLGVASEETEMGFSVSCQTSGFEYSGTSLNGLFAQRGNLLKPRYWRMLYEIMRFNRDCTRDFQQGVVSETETLGEYLQRQGYSSLFQHYYILPMVSAIWSSGLATAAAMPLLFFVRFFHNHGLLTVTGQPQWYTVKGGSNTYLGPLTKHFSKDIYTNCPVTRVERTGEGVLLFSERFGEQHFDEVVFACHSDQALAILADPSDVERAVLSAIPYQLNDVVLHTDENLLPRSKRAWASWNYLLLAGSEDGADTAALTYNMNILQHLPGPQTYCVSVNASHLVDPQKVLGEYRYSHPVFTGETIAAQARWADISGQRHTHFCGAYWRNGFHEDGVVSGLRVAAMLGEEF